VVAGQGTVALELLGADSGVGTIVAAVGGGGLVSGIALAAKAVYPSVRVIGVEPTGAPTLHESLRAGRLIELAEIRTAANTLAPRRSAQLNVDVIGELVDGIVLVSDEEMAAAARWLWAEMGVAAELSGAASVAAVLTGRVKVDGRVCAVVSGAGTDGMT
jgi:threonine dehydratase